MFHRLCGPPSIPLSFNLAIVLPRWLTYRFPLAADDLLPTASEHRLLRGLPGYLILFATHAFVLQRQCWFGKLLSQSVFCVISMHFTATLHIPPTASILKSDSFKGNSIVKQPTFTSDLPDSLNTL